METRHRVAPKAVDMNNGDNDSARRRSQRITEQQKRNGPAAAAGGHVQMVEEPELDAGLNLPHIPVGDMFGSSSSSQLQGDPELTASAAPVGGDRRNIALLLFLYVLQGIPLGLAGAMPFLLQNRQVSYGEQALFSFVFWPFSLKLLWAPIVDTIYWRRLGGLRKSWLVPTQYLIGAFMMILSYNTKSLLGDGTAEGRPHITWLTLVFFCLNFLAATQDIAVDGWALTMLHPSNVGYASTCNSVGQTAGYFMGNILFLTLESSDFANRYIRSVPDTCGLVTLSGFLFFWGLVFLASTTLVLVLKRELQDERHRSDEDSSIVSTYMLLWVILKKLPVRAYVVILLTSKIAFAAADSVTGLKLIEFGVPRESLAMLAVPMIPLQIVLPWLISRYTHGEHPLDLVLRAYPYRLMMGVVFALIVYITPGLKLVTTDGPAESPVQHVSFPSYYYVLLVIVYALHQITLYCMFVSTMAFHARVSDPRIGGTYMTLLNTLSNLGGNWPGTVVLYCVDWLTFRTCDPGDSDSSGPQPAQPHCSTWLDGYYVEAAVCTVVGVLWLRWKRDSVREIQRRPKAHWRIADTTNTNTNTSPDSQQSQLL